VFVLVRYAVISASRDAVISVNVYVHQLMHLFISPREH